MKNNSESQFVAFLSGNEIELLRNDKTIRLFWKAFAISKRAKDEKSAKCGLTCTRCHWCEYCLIVEHK